MLSRVVCYCVSLLCIIEPTTYLIVFLKTESPAVVVVENFEESLSEHPVLRQPPMLRHIVSNLPFLIQENPLWG